MVTLIMLLVYSYSVSYLNRFIFRDMFVLSININNWRREHPSRKGVNPVVFFTDPLF